MDISGIILAGGKSSRMGVNKALLQIHGVPVIQRLKETIQPHCHDLILVANDKEAYSFLGMKTVSDIIRNKGPLSGIYTGLVTSNTKWNFVVSCDLPFLSHDIAERIIHIAEKQSDANAIVPIINGKLHPLIGLYHSSILPNLEVALRKDRLRVRDLLNNVNVHYVTEKDFLGIGVDETSVERAFFNMNDPADYQEALNKEFSNE